MSTANALDVQSFSWGIENTVTVGSGGANGVVERLSLTYGSVQIESV